jgi:ribonuclease HI
MIVFVDGASNPKVMRSGIGVVFEDEVICEEIEHGTNNDAEYKGLICAMERGIERGLSEIIVYMDSMLVVQQVNGNWKINYKHLQNYNNEIKELIKKIKLTVQHVRREKNCEADYLSKYAIDQNKPSMDKKYSYLLKD